MCNKPGCKGNKRVTKKSIEQISDSVRVTYLGHNSGSIPWRCPSGHVYHGTKRSPVVDVYPEDVEFLEKTRRWKRVPKRIEIVEDTNSRKPIVAEKVKEFAPTSIEIKELAKDDEIAEENPKPKRSRRKKQIIGGDE